MIVTYHLHEHTWMEIFRAYQAMWDTPSLQEDAAGKERCLKRQCLYLMLSPFDNERSDAMHSLAAIKLLAELPMYKELVRLFNTREIFHYADMEVLPTTPQQQRSSNPGRVQPRTTTCSAAPTLP